MEDQSTLADAASGSVVSVFSLFGGQVLATLVAGFSSIFLARILGPEEYGKYSLSITIPGFLMLTTDFGLSAALAREMSRLSAKGDLSSASPLAGLALRFVLSTSLCSMVLGFMFSEELSAILLNRPELAPVARIALPLVVFNSLLNLSHSALLGLGDAKALGLLPIVRDTFRSIASLTLSLYWGCSGAVLGFVTGHALAAIVGLLLLRRRIEAFGPAEWGKLRVFLEYGLPIYGSTALGTALSVYQNSIIAWFATDEEVGNLKVAANFLALLQLFSAPIATTLFPTFSKLEKTDAKRAFRYAAKYSALMLAPLGAYVLIGSWDLVRLVYGEAYRLAPIYLSLQAVSFLWTGLGTVALGSFFQGIGETRVNFKAMVFYAFIFFPLSTALAPFASIHGVIAATLVSSLASSLYSLREAIERGADVDWRTAVRLSVAALLAAVPAALIMLTGVHYLIRLASSVPVYLLAYGVLTPILGCLDHSDLDALGVMLDRVPLRSIIKPILQLEGTIIGLVRSRTK
ncbi:MAG: oligosaccharide flippase family protein [Thermofilaceae archaeon]